ncbi:uncharacterized protein [Drosophila tropicalis]|uniref:uncharacterized protein n=1 Tax=Drosophila tropicalis TaxID=46794 RepID=UPI0035AB8EA6
MDVFDQQLPIKYGDAESLRRFVQTSRSCVNSLEKTGVDVRQQSEILVYYMMKRLPNQLRVDWERSISSTQNLPSFEELSQYLETQCGSSPQGVDILLGNDVYDELMLGEVHRGIRGMPLAQNTHLGYIVSGKTNQEAGRRSSYTITVRRKEADEILEQLLYASLKNAYVGTINEYLELGQMERVTSRANKTGNPALGGVDHCYLPHHPVIKESSSTTKYQRILWNPDTSDYVEEYDCTTVMFGTSSAPYLAMRVMKQLSMDECEKYPLAVDFINHQMDVDDILSGGDSIGETEDVKNQVIGMLRSGTFELRKWASNCTKLLENIPVEHRESSGLLHMEGNDTIRTLGLYWSPKEDEFRFALHVVPPMSSPTKRTILSAIARLFDPMGWLSPIMITAKILMQQLWKEKIGWDSTLPDTIKREWEKFVKELPNIVTIRIPRHVTWGLPGGVAELHLFCDASSRAYGATAYLRFPIGEDKFYDNHQLDPWWSCQLESQKMGMLPAVRVRPSRAFSSVGVDYAGPVNISPCKGRGRVSQKGYIAVFVCLVTKAIHLEPVGDLTSDAFIGAFNRFIGRRGLCTDVYSDCGTNFIGANKKLQVDKLAYCSYITKHIAPTLLRKGINWHFNPPSAPHFGGLWEAGVKSMKYHLKRTLGEQVLTFEEMATVLAQIESCLNSRPLCPLSNDPDDLMVLTPGHFLMGEAPLAPPAPELAKVTLIDRWRNCQYYAQQFWRRWNSEYLSRLQRRPKWLQTKENLTVGCIVLIRDERFSSHQWPLGRVMETHAGPDGLVRVVTLKTVKGLMKRPVAKLCPLPIQENWIENDTIPTPKR